MSKYNEKGIFTTRSNAAEPARNISYGHLVPDFLKVLARNESEKIAKTQRVFNLIDLLLT